MEKETLFTYYDERGFKMNYPVSWLRQNILQSVIFIASNTEETVKDFNVNVNLMIQNLSELDLDVDLEAFTALTRQNMKNQMPDVTDFQIEDTIISDLPAKEMVFRTTIEKQDLVIKQCWLVLGKLAFLFTYTADVLHYGMYEAEATDIIKSFEFGSIE